MEEAGDSTGALQFYTKSQEEDAVAESHSERSSGEFEFPKSLASASCVHGAFGSMLSADQLFRGGKLLPLYYSDTTISLPAEIRDGRNFASSKQGNCASQQGSTRLCGAARVESLSSQMIANDPLYHVSEEGEGVECFSPQMIAAGPLSPKAPTCTSAWKDLLGFKRVQAAKDGPNVRQNMVVMSGGPQICPRASKNHTQENNLRTKDSPILLNDKLICSDRLQVPGSARDNAEASVKKMELPITSRGAANKIRSASTNRAARTPSTEEKIKNKCNSPERRPCSDGASVVTISKPPRVEGLRGAIAARANVLRGLDRSYSNPWRWRAELQVNSRRKPLAHTGEPTKDGSCSMERCFSSSAARRMRVPAITNAPAYTVPAIRKGSKAGMFPFFSSVKGKQSRPTQERTAASCYS